ETVEGAALAAIDAVERWTELDFGVRPDLVAGGAQSLEHLLAGSGVLPQCRSGRSCNSYSSNHPCPQHGASTESADQAGNKKSPRSKEAAKGFRTGTRSKPRKFKRSSATSNFWTKKA